jgi:hypothetical protein
MYAIGRQSQVIPSFKGPILGVRFTKSIERQNELRESKQQERRRMMEYAQQREEETCARVAASAREQIEEELELRKKDEIFNLERRRKKGRMPAAEFQEELNSINSRFEELKRQGMDAEGNIE